MSRISGSYNLVPLTTKTSYAEDEKKSSEQIPEDPNDSKNVQLTGVRTRQYQLIRREYQPNQGPSPSAPKIFETDELVHGPNGHFVQPCASQSGDHANHEKNPDALPATAPPLPSYEAVILLFGTPSNSGPTAPKIDINDEEVHVADRRHVQPCPPQSKDPVGHEENNPIASHNGLPATAPPPTYEEATGGIDQRRARLQSDPASRAQNSDLPQSPYTAETRSELNDRPPPHNPE